MSVGLLVLPNLQRILKFTELVVPSPVFTECHCPCQGGKSTDIANHLSEHCVGLGPCRPVRGARIHAASLI